MKKEIIEKFETLITAAFGLVAALAWNSAIQQAFRDYLGEQSTLPAMFIYAIAVTIIAFILTSAISKMAEKAKK
jgi:Zn-dependent protease with chaperone function